MGVSASLIWRAATCFSGHGPALIDIDTRHALGEYYTPDWLCERVVDDLHLERGYYALDPACGSGSFLRAAGAPLAALGGA